VISINSRGFLSILIIDIYCRYRCLTITRDIPLPLLPHKRQHTFSGIQMSDTVLLEASSERKVTKPDQKVSIFFRLVYNTSFQVGTLGNVFPPSPFLFSERLYPAPQKPQGVVPLYRWELPLQIFVELVPPQHLNSPPAGPL